MRLYNTIKPTRLSGFQRNDLLLRIRQYQNVTTNSPYGKYWYATEKTIILYNLQKVNRKTKQTRIQGKSTQSEVIRQKHWVMHVYAIPFAWLDALGLKVEQRTRTFKIVSR